jgi:hypothetical protein
LKAMRPTQWTRLSSSTAVSSDFRKVRTGEEIVLPSECDGA